MTRILINVIQDLGVHSKELEPGAPVLRAETQCPATPLASLLSSHCHFLWGPQVRGHNCLPQAPGPVSMSVERG